MNELQIWIIRDFFSIGFLFNFLLFGLVFLFLFFSFFLVLFCFVLFKGFRIMLGTKIIFGIKLYLQHFHKKSYATNFYWLVKSDGSNIGPKLESVTTYHIRFIIKLLKKNIMDVTLLLFLLDQNFFDSQGRVFNIFIRMIKIKFKANTEKTMTQNCSTTLNKREDNFERLKW